ncbi:hypothetical protein DFH11DRAFT_883065 [Phellopilus nigrolimitatus]|nr:hypothetical protein DFH11DRAFT_883065 [Phellopilus nigrolimitatus]
MKFFSSWQPASYQSLAIPELSMPENPDTVSLKALDDLTDALSRLKAQGGALRGKECWINGWDSAVEYKQLDRAVEASKSSLFRLKNTRDTLSVLLRDVEHKLEAYCAEALPAIQHHGFAQLPDDILGSIFELCDDGEIKYKSAGFCNIISRVCHRFRAIALKLPKLWARVSNLHSPAELERRLARSENCWLTVELIVRNHSDFVKHRGKFFELVLEHKERWRAFKFLIWEDMSTDKRREVFSNLTSTTQFLEFPSLTDLTINDDRVYPADLRSVPGFTPEFFWSWKLPSLSSVHLRYHVPRSALWTELPSDLRWKPLLTSVHFRSRGMEDELDTLLRFLNTQPNLQDLSVSLMGGNEDVPNFEDGFPIANLPNLRSLSFTSHSTLMVRKIGRALMAPNVERFCLHLDLSASEDNDDVENDLYMLLIFELKLASLKMLSLAVTGDIKQPPFTASDAILHSYGKLEHLALEGAYLWPPGGQVDLKKRDRLPHLRTLRLTDCPRMNGLFVEKLATAFGTRSEVGEAASVEIVEKPGLRRDLEQSFLRDKVDWYERPGRTKFFIKNQTLFPKPIFPVADSN